MVRYLIRRSGDVGLTDTGNTVERPAGKESLVDVIKGKGINFQLWCCIVLWFLCRSHEGTVFNLSRGTPGSLATMGGGRILQGLWVY